MLAVLKKLFYYFNEAVANSGFFFLWYRFEGVYGFVEISE